MKKYTVSILFVLFIISGCGVANYQVGYEDANSYKEEKGISLFPNQESAISLARAEEIRSQAEINRAIANTIKSGEANGKANFSGSNFVGVIVNDSREKTIIVNHPNQKQKFVIEPGDFVFIFSPVIPTYVYGGYYGEKDLKSYRIFPCTNYYNGVKVDFGARIS